MTKLIAAAALVATTALGSMAVAAEHDSQSAGLKQLSWQQLQSACQNPAAFQSQRQPNAIRLTCEDTQLIWEAEQTDSVEMDNQRKIVASLSSDKYYIIRNEASVPVSVSKTMCPRLKEVEVTFTSSFALSCQEIQAFRGDMNAFCHGRVDNALKANQSLATRKATGRVYDMCAAPALVTQEPEKGLPGGVQPVLPAAGGKAAPGIGGQAGASARPGGVGGQRPALPGLGSFATKR